MTTAEQMVNLINSGQRQKAQYWFRNIRKRHGKAHADKLGKEVKELMKNEGNKTK